MAQSDLTDLLFPWLGHSSTGTAALKPQGWRGSFLYTSIPPPPPPSPSPSPLHNTVLNVWQETSWAKEAFDPESIFSIFRGMLCGCVIFWERMKEKKKEKKRQGERANVKSERIFLFAFPQVKHYKYMCCTLSSAEFSAAFWNATVWKFNISFLVKMFWCFWIFAVALRHIVQGAVYIHIIINSDWIEWAFITYFPFLWNPPLISSLWSNQQQGNLKQFNPSF